MKKYSKPVVSVDNGLAEGVYAASGAGLISGNGTPTLKVKLSYHQNPTDSIGFGDLVVTSDAGLSITGVSITD